MYQPTAADFADTGQWRLLLEIEATGLRAFLQNTIHKDLPLQPMCTASWEKNPDNLKKNIEEAVYSNPRLLDDFATKITFYDSRTLFIPTEKAEESSGAEEELYRKIYIAEPQDIMTEIDKDITAAWSPGKGVKSFIQRTFPGARVSCHLMDKVRNLRKENHSLRLYITIRYEEYDLILLDGGNLISASTHPFEKPDDQACSAINLLNAYGYGLHETSLTIIGETENSAKWDYLMQNVKEVKLK